MQYPEEFHFLHAVCIDRVIQDVMQTTTSAKFHNNHFAASRLLQNR